MAGQPTDYDLRIDEQTEKFLARKHQLTYFIVTAAVVPIGFAIQILNDREIELELSWTWGVLVAGGVIGLVAAGAALFSLWNEIRSHQLHIKYRYEWESLDKLSESEQAAWTSINIWAKRLLTLAFGLLVCEISLLAIGLVDIVSV